MYDSIKNMTNTNMNKNEEYFDEKNKQKIGKDGCNINKTKELQSLSEDNQLINNKYLEINNTIPCEEDLKKLIENEEETNKDIANDFEILEKEEVKKGFCIENREESEILKKIPFRTNLILKFHSKTINSITMDSKAQKMITGSSDYNLSFYDLHSMNKELKPFRTLQPMEQQIITSVDFDCKDENIIVSSVNSQPKIFTNEGKEVIEFLKGDMYIRDMAYTKGHTFAVTDCLFDKEHQNICYTSSKDGTLRVWDLNTRPFGIERQLPCKSVIKFKNKEGKKENVDKLLFTNKKNMLIGFGGDNIQCFVETNYYNRPVLSFSGKNPENSFTDCCFCVDPISFYTRDTEGTVKLFDLRKFDKPVKTITGLFNNYFKTGIAVSEDRNYIITGVSRDKEKNGKLVIIDNQKDEIVYEEDVGPVNIGAIFWNKKINQIFIGVGNDLCVRYDEKISKGGVLNALKRDAKTKKIEDFQKKEIIYVPNALSMYKPDVNLKRKRFDKVRQDEILTKKPEEMLSGPGFNGLISGPRTTIQNLMRTIHEVKGKKVDVLKRAEKFKSKNENPEFVDNAYMFSQPVKILDYNAPLSEDQKLMSLFKKCKHCGLKICQCQDYKKK